MYSGDPSPDKFDTGARSGLSGNGRNSDAPPAKHPGGGDSPDPDDSWATAVGGFVKRVCDPPPTLGEGKTSAVFRLDIGADGRILNVSFVSCKGRVQEDYERGVKNRLIGTRVQAPGVRRSIEVELESE